MVDLRLYALLDPERAGGHDLADLGRQVVAGGATLVQLRDKHGSTRRLIEETRAIKAALAPSGVPVLVNDRVDVALAAGADGVHVGQDDMPAADARRHARRGRERSPSAFSTRCTAWISGRSLGTRR